MRHLVRCIALVLLSTMASAGHAGAIGHSSGIGVDLGHVKRDFNIAGDDRLRLRARGNFTGIGGHVQRGAAWRIEGRVLTGSTDYTDTTENAVLIEGGATLGVATGNRERLYAGLAIESLRGNSPFADGSGRIDLASLYIPLGWSSEGYDALGWQTIIRLEGRGYVAGRDRIDDIPGIGDETFSRRGGFGLALSVGVRSPDGRVEIEPYLYWSELGSSSSERVDGQSVRTTDGTRRGAGARVQWLF